MNDFYATENENFYTRSYGEVDKRLIDRAFRFLFPDESGASPLYQKFSKMVNKQYRKLGCAVIWSLKNEDLPIGRKEIIITSQAVRATDDYRTVPTLLFSL